MIWKYFYWVAGRQNFSVSSIDFYHPLRRDKIAFDRLRQVICWFFILQLGVSKTMKSIDHAFCSPWPLLPGWNLLWTNVSQREQTSSRCPRQWVRLVIDFIIPSSSSLRLIFCSLRTSPRQPFFNFYEDYIPSDLDFCRRLALTSTCPSPSKLPFFSSDAKRAKLHFRTGKGEKESKTIFQFPQVGTL